jgi:hypothetical protein
VSDAALDPAVRLALRGALALVLLGAARHKLRDRARFRAALAGYRILPERAVPALAALLPPAEIAVALGLLVPALAAAPPLAAAALLSLYTGAIALNLARGRRDLDCGCGDPTRAQRLSGGLLLRNAALVGLAGLAALPAQARSLVWLDALTVAASAATLALLVAAGELALANASRLRRPGGAAWPTP